MRKVLLTLIILLASSPAFAKWPVTVSHAGNSPLGTKIVDALKDDIAHSQTFETASSIPGHYNISLLTQDIQAGAMTRGTSYAFVVLAVDADNKPTYLGSGIDLCTIRANQCAENVLQHAGKIIAASSSKS
ncbi:hypothetical protein ACYJW8_05135 [Frateuria aurantia]